MLITVLRCHRCQATLNSRVREISSGLGPPRYACRKCGAIGGSERVEWPAMTHLQKIRYIGLTLVYTLAVGFLGGGTACVVEHFIQHGPFEESLQLNTRFLLPMAIISGAVILFIQFLRVIGSIQRHGRAERRASVFAPSWFMAMGWMSLVISALMLTMAAGWFVSLVLYWTR